MQFLQTLRKNIIVTGLVLIYLLANLILTYREIYLLNLLPAVLLFLYLVLARIDLTYFVIVALTPLSVQFIEYLPASPVDFAIPTEPMLFGVLVLLIYRTVQRGMVDSRVFNHPVTYAILFNLFWILITVITSTMPLVSAKFLLVRCWFIAVYYWLAVVIFSRNFTNVRIFIWSYTVPMLIVIVYTVSRHIEFGLTDKEAAHFVMEPFFRDHTSYGAILAMLFFALGGLVLQGKRGLLQRTVQFTILAVLAIALILSYTRAAWISVLFALGILVLTLLRIRFRYMLIPALLAVVYFMGQRTAIVHKMEKNRQASSASIGEHVQSISNITTDESNLERINRWNCAMRMFHQKPVFGWGPGTYMFNYAPFQLSYEKTGISTDFGDRGNAHSEYIGPLAESGLLGSLSFILIGFLGLMTGFRVYRNTNDKLLKNITLGLLLGFITYLVHGALNNFLDTDKASALFWGFIAFFVAQDIALKELDPQH